MRYLVFTTKHHDDFCMYDSPYTDYDITRARLMPRPEGWGGIRQSEGASMASSD